MKKVISMAEFTKRVAGSEGPRPQPPVPAQQRRQVNQFSRREFVGRFLLMGATVRKLGSEVAGGEAVVIEAIREELIEGGALERLRRAA